MYWECMNNITILIPTFNRLNLVKKTINSCFQQSCKKFDLVVIDNCSSDGTLEYLRDLKQKNTDLQIIINKTNIGPTPSVRKALACIQTPWVTILCDDDYLEKDFIESSIDILEATEKKIVTVGYSVVNIDGNIKKKFIYARQTMNVNEALIKILDGKHTVAGVSGFFFKIEDHKYQKLYDYPKGFLTDTMLIIEKVLEGSGIEVIDKILYNRLEWDDNESLFSIQNMKLYFQALLIFGGDLKKHSNDYSLILTDSTKTRMQIVMPLNQFLRIVIMPIFLKGILSSPDLENFQDIIEKYDTRYKFHSTILKLCFPFMTRHSFFLRTVIYKFLLKLRNVKNRIS